MIMEKKNIEPIYIDRKSKGGRLTAEEFNRIPEKVNELVKAHNTEEERMKQVAARNRPALGQLTNVSAEADSLASDTCVLVWNGDAWAPMKLSELGIGQGAHSSPGDLDGHGAVLIPVDDEHRTPV